MYSEGVKDSKMIRFDGLRNRVQLCATECNCAPLSAITVTTSKSNYKHTLEKSDISLIQVFLEESGLSENSFRLFNKLRKVSAGFLRPKKNGKLIHR